ncbi:MAG: hypothetical protein K8L97_30625 [Anaerolineae bacterium]|nr:hypothetical protein [Anaerolineae bacterium]
MLADLRTRGHQMLNEEPEDRLSTVVRLLELIATAKDQPEIEIEELLLLASGELQKMDEEIKDAQPLDNWRKYLDEL